MKKLLLASVALLGLAVQAGPSAAQADAAALEKMRNMQTTGASLAQPVVPQTGRRADNVRNNLKRVKLPAGFKIDLYAVVPDARHMAVGPSSGVVFVGTRKTDLWAVTDRDKDRVADEVKRVAPDLVFAQPGPCFTKDGFLYVVDHNRVLVLPAIEFFFEGPNIAIDVVVPQGQLIPVEEESFNHGARVCAISPDNKLYISLGQPYNVTPPNKIELYKQVGIGGIIRMDRDGKNREVFATGVRNSVGIAFHPTTGELWFTDNQVDGMGDDIPPGEINKASGPGEFFGHPFFGGGSIRTAEYKDVADNQIPKTTPPQVATVAHAADLGLTFYTGRQFPAEYRGGLFSVQRGSWNRTKPEGARVMFTPIKPDGSGVAAEARPFAEGWLDKETGEYFGRLADVKMLADGSLLVSDDTAGAIYRISYGN